MSENILICLIYKAMYMSKTNVCARSAILAELIEIIHEGRLISNANVYD